MPSSRPPLFNLAFRPFFLFGGLFFVAALVRWGLFLNGWIDWQGSLSPLTWHIHEMTLGFGLAVVVGFLLTAVQNWTGIPGVGGWRLGLLVALWLGGRIILWLAPTVSAWWLALPDLLFLGVAAFYFAAPLVKRRQWRNLILLPGLAVVAALHLALLLPEVRIDGSALLWAIALFMTLIGGRVIPMFTANRFGLARTPEHPGFGFGLLGLTLVVMGLAAFRQLDNGVGRSMLALLALAQLWRLIAWYHRAIWRDPLIWTLHLSYFAIPLTAGIMAAAGPASVLGHNSLHILAIQGISLMILSMMCRVSLGHTGRPIQPPFWLVWAAVLMMLAMLARSLVPVVWPGLSLAGFGVAVWTAALAMTAFTIHYAPILNRPRVDDKPG